MTFEKVVVEIDIALLKRAMKALGTTSPSKAVNIALQRAVGRTPPTMPSKSKIETPTASA